MGRRLLSAWCAGVAVWLALQFAAALVGREPVVVASMDIARGERLSDENLTVVEAPVSSMGELATRSVDRLRGRIALAPMSRGQPVYEASLAVAPIPPDGSTIIEVRLASVPEHLIAGDHVDLVSSVGCAQTPSPVASGPLPQVSDGTERAAVCVLARDALTLVAPSARLDADSDNGSSNAIGMTGQSSEQRAELQVTVALDPDEALTVLAQQEAGPILAVSRASDGGMGDGDE